MPAVVALDVRVRAGHPSIAILGEERMGSGTLVDSGGYILAVNYVILGAETVGVTLIDGRQFQARVVARDYESGMGLLKIPPKDLAAIRLGSSFDLCLGQEVFLIGAIGGTERRVTNGVVSYLGEFEAHWEFALDKGVGLTTVNPGFGGAPVFDLAGRVVGITLVNLPELLRSTLAVPIERYQLHRTELLEFGRIRSRPERAWVGVYVQPAAGGALVGGLVPGGPADQAGLLEGDMIIAVDFCTIENRRDFYEELWKHHPGEALVLKVLRDGAVDIMTVIAG
ncbi:MAG: S1C family serine protease, partial [Candidatus Methylomirabilales bacterium]